VYLLCCVDCGQGRSRLSLYRGSFDAEVTRPEQYVWCIELTFCVMKVEYLKVYITC
jgi:hypothetical protein